MNDFIRDKFTTKQGTIPLWAEIMAGGCVSTVLHICIYFLHCCCCSYLCFYHVSLFIFTFLSIAFTVTLFLVVCLNFFISFLLSLFYLPSLLILLSLLFYLLISSCHVCFTYYLMSLLSTIFNYLTTFTIFTLLCLYFALSYYL